MLNGRDLSKEEVYEKLWRLHFKQDNKMTKKTNNEGRGGSNHYICAVI